jgi:type IV pilus assembly protein PilP
MKRLLQVAAGALLLSSLGACTADNDELVQWMEEQHKLVKPNVPPVYPPKKFDPQAYEGTNGVEPFGQQKLIPAGSGAQGAAGVALLKARAHDPQELESYPLDSMTMVGTLIQGGHTVALLLVENRLHTVKVGDWIGQNSGKITKITEKEITVNEVVQDAVGETIERNSTLQLQEKAR